MYETSPAQDPTERLFAAVGSFPGQPFALVDGGLFDDLPALFRRRRLFARSLFLEQADRGVRIAGPWLVALSQHSEAMAEVQALVGDRPAAVYWSCDAGETVLYRHLRTLNVAKIPAWAARGDDPPANDADGATATVMFRHWDPRVLGALLPVLDAPRFCRILGPAEEIAFVSFDHGGFRRVPADPSWPSEVSGTLTLDRAQIEALSQRRLGASHARIALYLRDVAPEIAGAMSPEALTAFVRESDRTGRNLGIATEAGHSRWAYLMMVSEGRVVQVPGALAFIRSGGTNPDRQVEAMIDRLARHFRMQGERAG